MIELRSKLLEEDWKAFAMILLLVHYYNVVNAIIQVDNREVV